MAVYQKIPEETLERIFETESTEPNPNSIYDPLAGTPFASIKPLEESLLEKYVSREEVHKAIALELKPTIDIETLKAEIDAKYPKTIWGDELPRLDVTCFITNKYVEAKQQANR